MDTNGKKKKKKRLNTITRADALFKETFAEIGKLDEFNKRFVLYNWKDIVDEHVYNHLRIQKLENKVLYLVSDNPAWADSFKMCEISLAEDINSYAGDNMVNEIKYMGTEGFGACMIVAPRKKALSEESSVDLRKKIKKIDLSDSEVNNIKNQASIAKDNDLRVKFEKLQMTLLKRKKLELERGGRKCPRCGNIIKSYEDKCYECYWQVKREKEEKIRDFLRDAPWASFGEIARYIDCTPEDVMCQRQLMIHEILPYVDVNDITSNKAIEFAMLVLQIPPEEIHINPRLVEHAYTKMRYDIGDKYFEARRKRKQKK